jgi:hypothetical protein
VYKEGVREGKGTTLYTCGCKITENWKNGVFDSVVEDIACASCRDILQHDNRRGAAAAPLHFLGGLGLPLGVH